MKLSYVNNKIVFVLVSLLCIFTAKGQCVFGSEYLPTEEQKSIPAEDNEEQLPADLLHNLSLVGNFFFLQPGFRIYKDGDTSGAKVFCSCQSPGCPSTVFVGEKLVGEYVNGFSQMDGLWGLVAHEIAHAYQCNLSLNFSGHQRELHADFLAGYYLANKAKATITNINQFAYELFKRGDFEFNDPQHHGTPDERVRMMLIGASVNVLTLKDASDYGYKLVTGTAGYYNIIGNWVSNNEYISGSPLRYNINIQAPSMIFTQFNILNGLATSASTMAYGLGGNQYQIVWPATLYQPTIVQDFFVIDNTKILVMYSTGIVDIWLRI